MFYFQKWTSTLIWTILVVTLSTSFVMGVNIGGPNVYDSVSLFSFVSTNYLLLIKQFIIPWARGYPFPCQKDTGVAQWVARVWWNCDYSNDSLKNITNYYYLPEVPINEQPLQRIIDGIHTISFVIGGTIGSWTGQYWYTFLTRCALNSILLHESIFPLLLSHCRRNAIFASPAFQVAASILMILALKIYHGYTNCNLDQSVINNVLKNKNLAIGLLYLSRFLSGWSAGNYEYPLFKRKTS